MAATLSCRWSSRHLRHCFCDLERGLTWRVAFAFEDAFVCVAHWSKSKLIQQTLQFVLHHGRSPGLANRGLERQWNVRLVGIEFPGMQVEHCRRLHVFLPG